MVKFAGIEEVVDFDTFVTGIHDVFRKNKPKSASSSRRTSEIVAPVAGVCENRWRLNLLHPN
jgi:hypothetical protein